MEKTIEKLRASARRTKFAIRIDRYVYRTKTKAFVEMLCLPIGFFKTLWLKLAKHFKYAPKYDLAITAIIKNEAQYVREWIEYHLLVGVRKFFIYDNESTDGIYDLLKEYVERGIVEYRVLKGKNRQNDAYNDSLDRNRKTVKYMAFIDLDEFLYADGVNVTEYLDRSLGGKAGGLAVNWAIFGSSGLRENTGEPVLERFLLRSDETFDRNRHVKTICKPQCVLAFVNPHYPVYLSDGYSVDAVGSKVDGAFTETVRFEPIRLNHYFCKSYEEFIEKRARGKADSLGIREESEFAEHDRNDVPDRGMLVYAEAIKDKLENR